MESSSAQGTHLLRRANTSSLGLILEVRLLICSFHVRQESMVTPRYWATVSYFNTVSPKVTEGYRKGRLVSFCFEPTTIANDFSLLTVRLLSENHLRTLLTSVWILGIMLSILGPE